MLGRLADLRLTGMTSTELQRLATAPAPAQAARAPQRHSQQRGGRARRATGTLPSKPLLDDAARLLITLLYQRFQLVESAWSYHHRPLIAGAVLIEAHDEWQVAERRYLSEGSMAKLTQTGDDDRRPKEVNRATAELVTT